MPAYQIVIICVVIAWLIFAALIVMLITMNSSLINAEDRRKELERLLFECEERKNDRTEDKGYN